MSSPLNLTVGAYVMKHTNGRGDGALVRIAEIANGCAWVEYVQIRYDGEIIGGGSSGMWPPTDFRPVTDPMLVLAARVHAARARLTEAKRAAESAEREAAVCKAAMDALREADEAAKPPPSPAPPPPIAPPPVTRPADIEEEPPF